MPHLRRALTGAFLLMALLAPSAQATKVNINGGATTLAFNAKTARAFAASGLSIKTVDGAKATKTGKALFPITGGRVDTVTGIGNVVHSGGLEFSAGKVSLTLSGLELNTATDKVTAAFSDIHITAFRLDTSSASFVRARGGGELTNIVVKLAKPGAEKLNSLLGTHTFKPGTVLGVASVDVDPVEYVVSGNKTTLTVASDASSALASLGITTGVGDGASVNENGSISFPITGGKVNVAGYDGRILHAGALTLTKDSTVVSLSSFTINTQKNQLSGLVNGAGPAYLLNLTEPENQLLDDDGRLEQNNITASLSAPAARALNEAFGTTAFTEGMILGYINTDIQLY